MDGNLGFLERCFPAEVAKALAQGRAHDIVATHNCATSLCCDIIDFAHLSKDLRPSKSLTCCSACLTNLANSLIFKADIKAGAAGPLGWVPRIASETSPRTMQSKWHNLALWLCKQQARLLSVREAHSVVLHKSK